VENSEEAMDLVLKLREIRRLRGLSQKDVAHMSGVGEKTISSFETGQRIGSLKLDQLRKLLGVYGITEAEFFGGSVEREIAPWELDADESAMQRLLDELRHLPKSASRAMVSKFQLMLEAASTVDEAAHTHQVRDKRPSYLREHPEWHMMTSRN
jgi:transcriptional regulator with XRE-family HTH domain